MLFSCGGTGGHINPAIAVAKLLRERHPDAAILFAGGSGGMETRLVPEAGFELVCCDMEGFSRKITPKGIGQNARALKKASASIGWAKRVISEFSPDVALGTGGYASFPIIREASLRGIPTIIHESNAYPGLTTRMLSGHAQKVLVNYEDTCRYIKAETSVVGMPIRTDMLFADKEKSRRELGIDERALIVSFWGSQGAREMNRCIAEFIRLEGSEFNHIHATGKFGYQWMPERISNLGVELDRTKNIQLREYITDMPRVMAAADLVMCRGGASTLAEVCAMMKPAIIVPSPNVTANHQEKNARVLERAGGAVVITEAECTPQKLYDTALSLIHDSDALSRMGKALNRIAVLDGAERIYAEIISALGRSNVK